MKKGLKKVTHKMLSSVLILTMVGSMMSMSVFAAEETVTHTAECSYVEATEGHDCDYIHEHDEDCGYAEATDEIPCNMNCVDLDEDGEIDHDPDCAYTAATDGSPCTFVHEHDETCGYVEAVEGVECDCQTIEEQPIVVTSNEIATLSEDFLTALTTAVASAIDGEIITLDGDIILTETLVINSNITLNLNDHILTGNGSDAVIQVADGVTFTLIDEGATTSRYWDWDTKTIIDGTDSENTYLNFTGGAITGGTPGVVVGSHKYDGTAKFIMNSGNVVGNEESSIDGTEGGGVSVYADFEMNGGTIIGNQGDLGAGVYVADGIFDDIDFVMNNGRISGNKNASAGGGVYVNYDIIQMNDGEISYNEALNGGGIFLAGSEFVMDGGEISYNKATTNGGGINHAGSEDDTDNTFTMKAGKISYNTAYQGGGVLSTAQGDKKTTIFNMYGGEITYNEATGGGGGGILNYATLNVDGGSITNNESWSGGSGVYNYYFSSYGDCTFTMRNCEITGNHTNGGTSGWLSSGVYYTNGAKVCLGANITIKDNTTSKTGYETSNLYVPYVSDWTSPKESVPFYILEDFENPNIGIFMHQLYKNQYDLPVQTHVFTVDYDTYKGTANPMQYFTSDINGYAAILDTENDTVDEVNEVCLTVCYDVTFEENNNEGDTDVADQTVISGGTATVPSEPTKATVGTTIYTFDGWYTSDDNGVTLSDTAYDFEIKVTSDLTLYAKWQVEETYIVDYVLNDGDATLDDESIRYGDNLPLPLEEPEHSDSDYIFNGWYVVVDNDVVEASRDMICTGNVTVYATWKKIEIDIEIDINVNAEGSKVSDEITSEMNAIEEFNSSQENPSEVLQWYTIDLTAKVITIELQNGVLEVVTNYEPVYEVVGPLGYLAPIGVLIDFDMEDKENLKLYRYHDETKSTHDINPGNTTTSVVDGNVTLFDEVYERQTPTNDSFYNFPIYGFSAASVFFSDEDLSNYDTDTHGNVAIYSGKFSTFAIGYDEVSSGSSTSSSGGGSSSTTYYDIEVDYEGSGTIEPDGGSDDTITVVAYGSETLEFTPSQGYEIEDVLVDGESIGAVSSYTFSRVTSDHDVYVIFVATLEDATSEETEEEEDKETPSLDRENHFAYMVGYPDDSFGQDRSITRAETVAMFARLITEEMDMDATYSTTFWDVNSDDWFANYVGFMEQFGIISGYEDGSFRGNSPITRAEFATIASRFDDLAQIDENKFSDVFESHWAFEYINSSAQKGWISGYPDGTFKPEQNITRAEAVTLVNNVLERNCDKTFVENNQDIIKQFIDINNGHWAYYQVMEATNGHDYDKDEDGNETWLNLK